jgi:hypothetical protein
MSKRAIVTFDGAVLLALVRSAFDNRRIEADSSEVVHRLGEGLMPESGFGFSPTSSGGDWYVSFRLRLHFRPLYVVVRFPT